MQTQKVMIVGAGFWGKRWIEAVRSHPDLELAGVVAKTKATLADVRGRYNLSKDFCFTDLNRALQAREAQIVAIVSPAAAHSEHVRAALAAGQHVICEKPLADSLLPAREMARIVRAHPQEQFMVAQTRRFTGQVETLRQTIAAGQVGRLDSIVFDHRVNYTGGGYRQRMEYPVLEDMICHHLDALRYITGQEPLSVRSLDRDRQELPLSYPPTINDIKQKSNMHPISFSCFISEYFLLTMERLLPYYLHIFGTLSRMPCQIILTAKRIF